MFGIDMSLEEPGMGRADSPDCHDASDICPPPMKSFCIDDVFAVPTFPTRSQSVHVKNGGVSLLLGITLEKNKDVPVIPATKTPQHRSEPRIKWANTLEEHCAPYEAFNWDEFDELKLYGPLHEDYDLNVPGLPLSPEPSYKIILNGRPETTSILK